MGALFASALAADKVKVQLFYESQCPGCRETITTSFATAFAAPDFLNMAEVTLYPYGNAHETQSGDLWEYTCQHGTIECVWNQVETCANHYITDAVTAFNFTDCIENNDSSRSGTIDYEGTIKTCGTQAKVSDANVTSITGCYNTDEGNLLEHQVALATPSDHQYVPWIVADGVHNDTVQNAIQSSLLDYVCSNYKGTDKSSACPSAGYMSIPAPAITVCENEVPTEFLQ